MRTREDLTVFKAVKMKRDAGKAATFSEEQLDEVTWLLCGKTSVIDKLMEEVGGVALENDKERENKSRGPVGFQVHSKSNHIIL